MSNWKGVSEVLAMLTACTSLGSMAIPMATLGESEYRWILVAIVIGAVAVLGFFVFRWLRSREEREKIKSSYTDACEIVKSLGVEVRKHRYVSTDIEKGARVDDPQLARLVEKYGARNVSADSSF